tara:strand:+ start:32 stop:199 length:168 start_codon:yes stop_codon:yes gene_type:complete
VDDTAFKSAQQEKDLDPSPIVIEASAAIVAYSLDPFKPRVFLSVEGGGGVTTVDP